VRITACRGVARHPHRRCPYDGASAPVLDAARPGHAGRGSSIDYTVKLEHGAGRGQGEEAFTVTFASGRRERMRLHDYDRVYAVPGLYEEVVQRILRCASPAKIAEVLLSVAALEGREPHLLRVLDLGAGNGLVGEELRARGVVVLAGTDSTPKARAAAVRDRAGLYASYVVGDLTGKPELGTLVRELGLNCIVCAGALGLDHIEAHSFAELWDLLPPGAMFALTVHEDLAQPGASDIGDELAALGAGRHDTEIVVSERFRHRLSVAGEPIHYLAIGARKRDELASEPPTAQDQWRR
jgi:SAM-dependent methyltransferase